MALSLAMTAFGVVFASGMLFLSTAAEKVIAFVVALLVAILIGLVGSLAAAGTRRGPSRRASLVQAVDGPGNAVAQ